MTFKPFTFIGGAVAAGALLLASAASADTNTDAPNLTGGRAEVYQQISPDSLEAVSTRSEVLNLDAPNLAPTHIWKVLEHGEKLECLACVPVISKLLYSSNPKTREISAWWLRRRIFGVFGPGQVYEQTLKTLADANETESHRVYAANAIGEFLDGSGVGPLSKAVVGDESAAVRAAAVAALERLNSPGEKGEISAALGDSDADVRLGALHAATRINSFTDVAAVIALISDGSSLVRRRAAETLGVFKNRDAVAGLIALASPDQESDSNVRAAAVWALGQIGDPAARDVIKDAESDSDMSVRSAAAIAGRMLRLRP
jgi:HEAT repeat protein